MRAPPEEGLGIAYGRDGGGNRPLRDTCAHPWSIRRLPHAGDADARNAEGAEHRQEDWRRSMRSPGFALRVIRGCQPSRLTSVFSSSYPGPSPICMSRALGACSLCVKLTRVQARGAWLALRMLPFWNCSRALQRFRPSAEEGRRHDVDLDGHYRRIPLGNEPRADLDGDTGGVAPRMRENGIRRLFSFPFYNRVRVQPSVLDTSLFSGTVSVE